MNDVIIASLFALAVAVALILSGPVDLQATPAEPGVPSVAERPVVNVPAKLRKENWLGSRGEGSCVHASLISLLRWQGQDGIADSWPYSDGEYPDSFHGKLQREGVRYAYTTTGDEAFLDWAISTRRGCGITVHGGAHMVDLVHLDSEWAAILDNNFPASFKWIPRKTLLAEWHASNGWAVAPVYSPAAPVPQSH